MRVKDEARITMYKAIVRHLETNPDIVSLIPVFAAAITALKSLIAAIENADQLTKVNLTGITVAKNNAKTAAAQASSDMAGVVVAYASATGNDVLEAEVDYTFYKLKRMRDEQLAPICRIIHDRAFENATALLDYGITRAKITALQTAIDDYVAKTPNPRTALGSRKTKTAQIPDFFKQADDILKKQIDKLVKTLRVAEPEFHDTYFNLREIRDPSTTTTTLKGIVTDSATNLPIKNATVTIVELAKTTQTDSKGEYEIKPIEHGTYTVTATKTGYQPFERDGLEILMGGIRHLTVNLVR